MSNDEKPKRDQGKQKKLLLIMAPIFVVLAVLQGPTLLGVVTGSEETTEDPLEATADADPLGTDSVAPPADTPDADVPAGPNSDKPEIGFTASDIPPRADSDELTRLSPRFFVERDPFMPGIDGILGGEEADESDEGSSGDDADQAAAADADSPDDSSSSGGSDDGDTSTGGDDLTPGGGESEESGSTGGEGDEEARTTPDGFGRAEIQVNGAKSLVAVGGAFPSFDPVFRLESLAGNTVRIGLVRGSYSTGAAMVDLERGETRTLVSQPDGTRYRIRLVSVDL